MTFKELQDQIGEYVYHEDDGMTRVALASIIANRVSLGDPIWLILIGPSSSGKSQVLRPLALTDEKFIHRVDDLTENTLLSGAQTKEGAPDISLLKRIGEKGIVVISDFTGIFSKSSESRDAILGQLRMVYDGEMTKYTGTKSEPIQWKGSLGVLAGSTPSIYSHFEQVADMGERFIYYRMKPYNSELATRRSLKRSIFGRELDGRLSLLYAEYIKDVTTSIESVSGLTIPDDVYEKIIDIALFAALLRTPTHYDRFERAIDRIPIPEMPMRVALQLSSLAKGFMVMNHYETGTFEVSDDDIKYLEWCAYSLANEERRACLKVLAQTDYALPLETQVIADTIGLSTDITKISLQHLAAIGVLMRSGGDRGLIWRYADESVWERVRRIEGIEEDTLFVSRDTTYEEQLERDAQLSKAFDDIK